VTPLFMTLERFGGFAQEQRFNFPSAPGLYFLQGRNDDEPRLGSNGAGKSTIWKALFWLFFGKTPDGLKAGDICSWNFSKGAKVVLVYMAKNGEPRRLTRTWGPNSWTLEFSDRTEDKIVDLAKGHEHELMRDLGAQFEPYLHSVLMAQEGTPFLDLKGEAQATLFSEVLGLNQWVSFSERAGKEAAALDRACRQLETDVAKLQGQLIAQEDFAPHYQVFERERTARIDALTARYDKLVKESKQLEAAIEKSRGTQAKGLDAIQAVRAEISDAQVAVSTARRRQLQATNAEKNLLWHITQVERDQQTIEEHDACPLCRQDLAGNRKRDPLMQIGKDLSRLEDQQAEVQAEADAASDDMEKAEKKLSALLALEKEAEHLVADNNSKLSTLERNLKSIDQELNALEDDVDELQREKNPYQDLHKQTGLEVTRLTQELKLKKRDLDDLQEQQSISAYWVRGFKEVRLQLIAEALSELEIEVNSSAMELGLVGWELRFGIDRETKGGGIQKGFTCHVIGPNNPRPVPWDSWSGGERQRLRNAGEMGLSNLIRTRMGVKLNLEVWDEPSRGLSPAGVKDLLDTLAKRAELEQRQIWIVDHTSYSYGGFSGGALVVKTAKGESVIHQD